MSVWLFLRFEFHAPIGIAAIGPHRAAVLEAIDRFGSLSAAAPAVDLTFRQFWRVVQMLNKFFDAPLIGVRRGGRSGGAFLTPVGKELLARYREMERLTNQLLESHFHEFEKLVGIDPNAPPPVPRYAQVIDPSTIPVAGKKQRANIKRRAQKSSKDKRAATKKRGKKMAKKSSLAARRR